MRTALLATTLAIAMPMVAEAKAPSCRQAPRAVGDVVVLSMHGGRGARTPYWLAGAEHETRAVAVTGSGSRPVTLVLSAREPTVWDLTAVASRVHGVIASGSAPQAVAGLPASVPVAFSGTPEPGRSSACGVPIAYGNLTGIREQADVVAGILGSRPRRWYGGYDPSSFDIDGGRAVRTSTAPPVASVRSATVVRTEGLMPGGDGIQQLISQGAIRRFSRQDLADWTARGARLEMVEGPFLASRAQDPLAYLGQTTSGYLVLRTLPELPSGLEGADSAVFVLPRGVSMPTGIGDSTIYHLEGYDGAPPEGSEMVGPDLRSARARATRDAPQPATAFVEWDADGKVLRDGSVSDRQAPGIPVVAPSRQDARDAKASDKGRDMTPSALLSAMLLACGGIGALLTRRRGDPLAGIRHRAPVEDPLLALERSTPDVEEIVDGATAAELQRMLAPLDEAMDLAFEEGTSLSLMRFRRKILDALREPEYDTDLGDELDSIVERDLVVHLRAYLTAARNIVDGRASVLEAALRVGIDRLSERIEGIMDQQSDRRGRE
jgi:hypothetical protein